MFRWMHGQKCVYRLFVNNAWSVEVIKQHHDRHLQLYVWLLLLWGTLHFRPSGLSLILLQPLCDGWLLILSVPSRSASFSTWKWFCKKNKLLKLLLLLLHFSLLVFHIEKYIYKIINFLELHFPGINHVRPCLWLQ